jgi:nudix-type nucleoside diphosphatase (YffH/AdpP family)
MRKVEIQNKHLVFDDVFKIQEARLRFQKFNGQMSEPVRRLVFERGDSAAALLFNRDTQKILLINQFRYPTYEKGQGWLCEVVAGAIDANEQPEESIKREIREEIGYEANVLTHIATFYVSPGGTSERIILFYSEVGDADRVSAGGGLASEHEDIQLVELTLPDLWRALENGDIVDAKTLVAAQWLQQRKQGATTSE